MNWAYLFSGVAVMALVTYLPRVLPLVLFRKKIENRFVVSFLDYVPFGVLAAMTLPDILTSTNSLLSAGCGFVIAVLLALRNRGLLTVAVAACGTVFLVEQILQLI